jgi:hypothetical protein
MGLKKNGGPNRDRTDDLLHAMQALSQLSYGPSCEINPAQHQSAGKIIKKHPENREGALFMQVKTFISKNR